MAGILQSRTSTYEFSLAEMKKLIALDLGTTIDKIDVEYVKQDISGPLEMSPRYEISAIRVTLKHT